MAALYYVLEVPEIETTSYVPEIIKRESRNSITHTVARVKSIPLRAVKGLSAYRLGRIRIESVHRQWNGNTDFEIHCELFKPSHIKTEHYANHSLPIIYTQKRKQSGTDEFLYIACECELPERTQAVLRPTVRQVLNCLADSIAS